MKDRIDALIYERAPWIERRTPLTRLSHKVLDHLLGYRKTVQLAETVRDDTSVAIMRRMGQMLARRVNVEGLHNLPVSGPALIVANHPTGIADGIILHHLVAQRRPDIYVFANKDILRLLPQMEDMICPVEWRIEKRSRSSARETMQYVRKAKDDGRLGLIFPSGRLAKRRGLTLHERPWMSSAAMLARKFELPVVPIHLEARNSALFYLFDLIHPTLRDITLFHETLNKARQPYQVTIGTPIDGASLPKSADDGIALLKEATLELGTRSRARPALPVGDTIWQGN